MGYITSENKPQVVKLIIQRAKELEFMRPDYVTLSDKGIEALVSPIAAHIDKFGFGSLDLITFGTFVNQIRNQSVWYRSDFPFPDDANLVRLVSIEDVCELSAEKVKRFMQPAATIKDSSGTSALERFNARTKWLKDNNVHRPPQEQPVEAERRPYSPEEAEKQKIVERVQAIVSRIDGLKPAWSRLVQAQQKKLHTLLNDLLRDKNTIDDIERAVSKAFRDLDSPFH